MGEEGTDREAHHGGTLSDEKTILQRQATAAVIKGDCHLVGASATQHISMVDLLCIEQASKGVKAHVVGSASGGIQVDVIGSSDKHYYYY